MSDISFPHSLEMFSICPLFTHVFFIRRTTIRNYLHDTIRWICWILENSSFANNKTTFTFISKIISLSPASNSGSESHQRTWRNWKIRTTNRLRQQWWWYGCVCFGWMDICFEKGFPLVRTGYRLLFPLRVSYFSRDGRSFRTTAGRTDDERTVN